MTDASMNHTTMLGTYALDGNAPVDPEIVLSNCRDTAMLGRLVGMFADSHDVRFFLIHDIDPDAVDLGADFHFVRDAGEWVLANNDTMLRVLFDDTSFSRSGAEGTFSLTHLDDGAWGIDVHADLPGANLPDAGLHDPAGASLLVDSEAHDIFVGDHVVQPDAESGSIFIDPSVLQDGKGEIVVTNFVVGQDTLELPQDMFVRDVSVDSDHNLTELIIGQQDAPDDIVIKLLNALPGPGEMPSSSIDLDSGSDIDHLIQHIIDSPEHS